ncbi:MAG: hypothetical protein AAFX76_09545 [Planctomycetota bacterium]
MIRAARRRHAVIWLVLGPALLAALVYVLASRPAAAVSDGPVPLNDAGPTPAEGGAAS